MEVVQIHALQDIDVRVLFELYFSTFWESIKYTMAVAAESRCRIQSKPAALDVHALLSGLFNYVWFN